VKTVNLEIKMFQKKPKIAILNLEPAALKPEPAKNTHKIKLQPITVKMPILAINQLIKKKNLKILSSSILQKKKITATIAFAIVKAQNVKRTATVAAMKIADAAVLVQKKINTLAKRSTTTASATATVWNANKNATANVKKTANAAVLVQRRTKK
jgi:hypothetical protein